MTVDFNVEPVEFYFLDQDGNILAHSEVYDDVRHVALLYNGDICVWLDTTRPPNYYPVKSTTTLELMKNNYTKGLQLL